MNSWFSLPTWLAAHGFGNTDDLEVVNIDPEALEVKKIKLCSHFLIPFLKKQLNIGRGFC